MLAKWKRWSVRTSNLLSSKIHSLKINQDWLMNLFQDDITKEFDRIQNAIASGQPITVEDMKIILLSALNEEDLHEGK